MHIFSLLLTFYPASAGEKAVQETLDDWHQAAAAGDEERYFGHFTPDAVFMGTDATERWTRDAFRGVGAPSFCQGSSVGVSCGAPQCEAECGWEGGLV